MCCAESTKTGCQMGPDRCAIDLSGRSGSRLDGQLARRGFRRGPSCHVRPDGWIGYTWAHTRHRDRHTGEVFDGDFDQRHTLNVFIQQRLSYRMNASVKLRLGSSFPIVGYFEGDAADMRLAATPQRGPAADYARLDIRSAGRSRSSGTD